MKKLFLSSTNVLYLILGIMLLLRASTLEITELIDPTETRYATIAVNMLKSNDFVIPRLYDGDNLDTYFSKPPLHFWLTSIAFKLFGIDEWTARLPSFLSLLVITVCLILLGKKLWDERTGIVAAIICISFPLVFFMSGGSHVDLTFSACITIALTAFMLRVFRPSTNIQNEIYSALFFIAAALSFLTKGPVGLVLILLPIGIWILVTKSFHVFKLPSWKIGGLLFLIITVPWFYYAEKASPGFLRYYFINENYLRYVTHDYGGRHGGNHTRVYGYIWVLLLLGTLPWSFLAVQIFIKHRSALLLRKITDYKFVMFCIIWGISPAIFFTISSSILPAYLLPGMPALAMCLALVIKKIDQKDTNFNNKLSILEILTSALIISLPIVGLIMKIDNYLLIAEIMTVILLFGLFVLFKVSRFKDTYVRLALILTLFFTSVILLVTDHLGDNKSSDGILNHISNVTKSQTPRVAIVGTANQSPIWTSLAWKNELSKKIVVRPMSANSILDSDIQNMINRTKSIGELPLELTAEFELRKTIGGWTWYVRKKTE